MPSRRQSRGLKTRNGCAQCKQRRIKCDEKKLSCFNCNRFNQDCSFQHTEPFLFISRALLQPNLSNPSSHVESEPEASRKHRNDQLMLPCEPSFTLEDMRLLHHFTTYTVVTLSDHTEAQMVWSTSIVNCAFQHPFLLQGILAIAALHLAARDPKKEDRLSIMAASKQNIALHDFRSQMERITPENCDALFAFSFLASYYIPASAGTVINPSGNFLKEDMFNAIVYWLQLCHGTSSIYHHSKEWIGEGPLSSLFWPDQYSEIDRSSVVCEQVPVSAPHERRLRELEDLCQQDLGREGLDSATDIEEKELNAHALGIFMKLFRRLNDQHNRQDVQPSAKLMHKLPELQRDTRKRPSVFTLSLAWLFEIPLGFIELLEQQRPISLVIFAHFALLLLHAPQFWWNKPIAMKIVKAVNTSLATRYHRWIKWPLHEIMQRYDQMGYAGVSHVNSSHNRAHV
ncbi:uncharacterized protein N7483_003009 [Penicillium malachiteum]|uniref:uncharacterized protein n=1 Tax=Penicillium malachiteum TaxID=1324776 RepID=UPI0025494E4C|nr:uncharacterized protein N7483_003009 [Penicillium malachiteum]KAJ5737884.1 hypothetical protein N7483_003009 [Penicillium malachiteum]